MSSKIEVYSHWFLLVFSNNSPSLIFRTCFLLVSSFPLSLFLAQCNLSSLTNTSVTILDIIAAAVLSGNRNFEGRVHPLTRANYLASPPLVVAYALAGTVCIQALPIFSSFYFLIGINENAASNTIFYFWISHATIF